MKYICLILIVIFLACNQPPDGIYHASNSQIAALEYVCNFEYMIDKQKCYTTNVNMQYFNSFVYAPIFSKKTGKFITGVIFLSKEGNSSMFLQSLNDIVVRKYCSCDNDSVLALMSKVGAEKAGFLPSGYNPGSNKRYLALQDYVWSIERDILKEQKD